MNRPLTGLARAGFTLIEIMVSIMIFVVVGGAMVGILMVGSELFRNGEASRAANDETVAVLGSLEDDLNRMIPGAADGFVFSRVMATNGNCLFAFNARTANPESITSRGYRARSLVAFWVEQQRGDNQPERLRRIALDDQHDVLDVVNALHAADGRTAMRTRIATGVRSFQIDALDDQGNAGSTLVSVGPGSQAWEWEWLPRRALRRLETQHQHLRVIIEYNWNDPVLRTSGTRESYQTEIYSSVLTQGCLHFSSWLALQDLADMKRPRTVGDQPDWEQLHTAGGTRLGPWNGSNAADFDTAPEGPQATLNANNIAPFPTALRLSMVLTGGSRFAPSGALTTDLDPSGTSFGITGVKTLSTTPGAMIRVQDEWIAYTGYQNGRVTCTSDGRGQRRTAATTHGRGQTVRVGQSYSLVRLLPK